MPRKGAGAPGSRGGKGRTRSQEQGRSPFRNLAEGERFLADITTIAPNPLNVREEWEYEDDEEFNDFVGNLEELGQLQDPTVILRAEYEGAFPDQAKELPEGAELVLSTGERRWRAQLALGVQQIPVVLRNSSVTRMNEILWSENQSRKGLDPVQEGTLFLRFRRDGLKLDEIARRIGKRGDKELSVSEISKKIKLADLPDGPMRRAIRKRELGVEPAYLLITKLKEPERISEGYALMQEEKLTAVEAIARLDPTPLPRSEPSVGTAKAPEFSATKTEPDRTQEEMEASDGGSAPPPSIPSQACDVDALETGADEFSATKTDGARDDGVTARLTACRQLLAERSYVEPETLTSRLAEGLVRHMSTWASSLAEEMLQPSVPDYPFTGTELVRYADALALACDELRARNDAANGQWDQSDALHVQRLIDGAGYEPSEWEVVQLNDSLVDQCCDGSR